MKKIASLIFILCSVALASYSQKGALDSLKNLLRTNPNQLSLYEKIALKYYISEPDSAEFYSRKGISINEISGNIAEVASNFNVLGLALQNKGLYHQSIEAFDSSAFYYSKLNDLKKVAINKSNIAGNYLTLKNYTKAMALEVESIKIFEDKKDTLSLVEAYRTLAIVYRDNGNLPMAEKYFKRSVYYAKSLNGKTATETRSLSGALSSYGLFLSAQGKYDDALSFVNDALTINKSQNDNYNIGLSTENLGDVYQAMRDYDKALENYITAKNIFSQSGDSANVGYETFLISTIYFQMKKFDQSVQQLLIAEHLFTIMNLTEYKPGVYQLLSDNYEQKGQLAASLKYFKKYISLRDSLNTNQQKQELLRFQTEFETLQKEKEIESLNNEKIISKKESARQTAINYLLILGIILLVASGIFFYYRYRLNQRLKETQMRSKIAEDLHDDVGSTLSSILMISNFLKDKNTGDAESVTLLDKITGNAKEILEKMSDIVWTIKPGNDSFNNIQDRMSNFANEICIPSNIVFRITENESLNNFSLTMEQRRDLFLIFKEAINNAIKHSSCTFIDVSFSIINKILVMNITDNGKGFDTTQISHGNGLDNFQRRAGWSKGEFTIQSVIGKGTSITVKMPLT